MAATGFSPSPVGELDSAALAALATEIINRTDADEDISTAVQANSDAIMGEILRAEAAEGLALPKAGGTLSGPLTLAGDPTADLHAATKQYVLAVRDALVNGAPGILDTLKELADALQADESIAAALATTVAGKASTVSVNALTARITAAEGVNTTQDATLANEVTRATTAEAAALPKTGGTMTGAFAQTPVALTDAATIVVDASTGNVFKVTLAGNRTLANPTNPQPGQRILFRLRQDATGGRTITWDTKYRFSDDLPTVTLSTAASKLDRVMFEYNVDDDKWDCVGAIKGF